MRYTSSHPYAFRNKIAKSIGVLVAAALVAVLGLPTAAQAQTPSQRSQSPCADAADELVSWWRHGTCAARVQTDIKRWIVTFTEPGTGDELVLTDASGDANDCY